MDAELNSALGNERYFYPRIGCGTQKSTQTSKSGLKLRKTTFARYSRKTDNYWDQTFLTRTCPETVRLH